MLPKHLLRKGDKEYVWYYVTYALKHTGPTEEKITFYSDAYSFPKRITTTGDISDLETMLGTLRNRPWAPLTSEDEIIIFSWIELETKLFKADRQPDPTFVRQQEFHRKIRKSI